MAKDISKDAGFRYEGLVRPEGFVHRRLYTDPEIFADEMVKIFGAGWVFLLHEAEIPNVNDFKTITVGRRSTIVTRDSNGIISALLNRCTHRGSPVCFLEQGNARRFVCPYHNWTFDNGGKLMSVPLPDGYGQSFDRSTRGLGKFPRVENYRGFVFGSLNPTVEPLSEWLGHAKGYIDWTIDSDPAGENGVRIVRGSHMYYKGNWKHQADNDVDGYHAPFLHNSTALMNRRRHGAGRGLAAPQEFDRAYVKYLGNGHKLLDTRAIYAGEAWERARPIPGRETHRAAILNQAGPEAGAQLLERTGRTGINLIIFPNLFILGNGSFAVFEPVAVNRTNIRYYTVLINDAPNELNTLRIRFEEDFNNVGGRDDAAALEAVQDSLESIPEMEWLDVSRGVDRETVDETGLVRGHKTDETPVRHSYGHWLKMMSREPKLSVGNN